MARGEWIVVGGAGPEILGLVAGRAEKGLLLVASLASSAGMKGWREYQKLFGSLGVKKLEHLDLETRLEDPDDRRIDLVKHARLIFFPGGDHLRITSCFGGSKLRDAVRQRFEQGMAIAGTAAGASVLTETMLVSEPAEDTHQMSDTLRMAPGLDLIHDLVIDQHFAERGRLCRLLGAVAQNPRLAGIGVDENTALIARDGRGFEVAGAGAVYVVNGQGITYTNLSESQPDAALAVHGLRLDVLSDGDRYDLERRAAVRQ